MFEEFYRLTTNPFRLAPDPDFCFRHSGYQNAREYLEYALEQGEGFVMVTGRPGTGKTMLVETFLRGINTNKVIAKRIAVSNYGADELLRAMAYAYEITVAEPDKASLRHRIQEYFLQQEQAGRRVLMIMDEAQALQHSALEELRTLADLQTRSRTMLQLFLVGQDSLQDLMSTPDMEQFQQRVIANYHLIPLNLKETRAYIEHRLLTAGWRGDPEFTGAAVLSVYQLSKGVPRHINKICNRLLLLGYGKGSYIFDQQDVQAISSEMHDEHLTPMKSIPSQLPDADSIPEIRDASLSLDDLAIRGDKVDAGALAISMASRLTAMKKKQFMARHDNDPASWYPDKSPSADPFEDTAAVPAEQPDDSIAAEPGQHHHQSVTARRLRDRTKWRRETVVLAVAALVVTAITLVALPSILIRASDADRSPTDANQASTVTDTIATGQSAARVGSEQAGTRAPVTGERMPGDNTGRTLLSVQNASDALPAQHPAGRDNAAGSRASQAAQAMAKHRLSSAPQQTADTVKPLAVGYINRGSLASAGPLPVVDTASVQTALVSDVAVHTMDTSHQKDIQVLLSLGRQSLADYRLLTPEDDNAHDYFRAVLRQDPSNEAAQAGIQDIVDLYITLAKKAVNQQNQEAAARYVDRGLSIQSGNRELLALKERIENNKGNALVLERGVPVSKGTLSAMEQASREDIILRITSFFKKRKLDSSRTGTAASGDWDG
jgi:type II secretory pathway predicted ATPase ExeA